MYDRRAEIDPLHPPPSGPSTYAAECSRLMSTMPCRRGAGAVLDADVDDAGGDAAVGDAEVAGEKVDAIDQLGRQHAGPDQEVIQQRDLVALDVDARIVGRGAADDQRAQAERRARHARQVLHDAQRIAERAGDVLQLGLRQLVARHRRAPASSSGRSSRKTARRSSEPGSPAPCACRRAFVRREVADAGLVARLGDDHAQAGAGLALDLEAALGVGAAHDDRRLVDAFGRAQDDRHLAARQRIARPLLAQAPDRDRTSGRRRRRGRRGATAASAAPASGDPAAPAWARSAACIRSGSPPACRRSRPARTGTASPRRARPRRSPAPPAS